MNSNIRRGNRLPCLWRYLRCGSPLRIEHVDEPPAHVFLLSSLALSSQLGNIPLYFHYFVDWGHFLVFLTSHSWMVWSGWGCLTSSRGLGVSTRLRTRKEKKGQNGSVSPSDMGYRDWMFANL